MLKNFMISPPIVSQLYAQLGNNSSLFLIDTERRIKLRRVSPKLLQNKKIIKVVTALPIGEVFSRQA